MNVVLHSITKGVRPDELELHVSVGEQSPECFRIYRGIHGGRSQTLIGDIFERLAGLGAEKYRDSGPPRIQLMLKLQAVLGGLDCRVPQQFPVRLDEENSSLQLNRC